MFAKIMPYQMENSQEKNLSFVLKEQTKKDAGV